MSTETALPVTVSPRAAKRIAEIIAAEGRPAMLRLAVTGGGCSGFPVQFRAGRRARGRRPGHRGRRRDRADRSTSLEFLKGAEIDFVDDLIGASFKVNNPNATSSCGCGTSFSV